MNKPYGTQGELINFPFKDLQETIYNHLGIEVEIKEGILCVGVDDESKLEEAKNLALLYLAAWSERQKIKTKVNFNHRWFTDTKGSLNHHLKLADDVHLTERVQLKKVTHQVEITGKSFIVTQEMHDSVSFTNDIGMVNKALNNNDNPKMVRIYLP